MIYANDHRPAHVHAIGQGHVTVFKLNCPAGPVELRENYSFSKLQLTRIRRILAKHLEELCLAWERIHGDY